MIEVVCVQCDLYFQAPGTIATAALDNDCQFDDIIMAHQAKKRRLDSALVQSEAEK